MFYPVSNNPLKSSQSSIFKVDDLIFISIMAVVSATLYFCLLESTSMPLVAVAVPLCLYDRSFIFRHPRDDLASHRPDRVCGSHRRPLGETAPGRKHRGTERHAGGIPLYQAGILPAKGCRMARTMARADACESEAERTDSLPRTQSGSGPHP